MFPAPPAEIMGQIFNTQFPTCPVWIEMRAVKPHKSKLCFTLAKTPNDSKEHPRGTLVFWLDSGHPGQLPRFAKADLLRDRHMEGCRNAPALFSFSGFFQVVFFFQVYWFKTETFPRGKTKVKKNFFEKYPWKYYFWISSSPSNLWKVKVDNWWIIWNPEML